MTELWDKTTAIRRLSGSEALVELATIRVSFSVSLAATEGSSEETELEGS